MFVADICPFESTNLVAAISPQDHKMNIRVEPREVAPFGEWCPVPALPYCFLRDFPPAAHKSRVIRCRQSLRRNTPARLKGRGFPEDVGNRTDPSIVQWRTVDRG